MLSAVKNAVLALVDRSKQPAHAQPELNRAPPIGLCELPLELLTMILEDLEWTDILRVRKTCKALQEISKARSIWLNLCSPHLLATATAPQALHLERPLSLYTAQELEFHFLRLKSASIGWKTDDKSPARRREFVTPAYPACMHMVEGGRWLLVASTTGSISYFDLEASDPTETTLIPEQFQREIIGAVVLAIDLDYNSSFLAFNLAVSYCSMARPVTYPKQHMIHIWKVSLTLDDQQRGAGLSAEHLASFPQELPIRRVSALSLRGPHLALSVFCPADDEPDRVFVIDWKQVDGEASDYRRRLLHPCYGPKNIHLLPGGRLFTVADEAMMLFDYSDIEETTSMPLPNHSGVTATPLWEKRGLHARECGVSQPFFCSSSIRFSFPGEEYLYGVIVAYPYDQPFSEDSIRIVKVMDFPPISKKKFQYAYNHATIVDRHHDTHLISYTWPDEENHVLEPTSLHKEDTFMNCRFGPFLDEGSGRVVVSASLFFNDKDPDKYPDDRNWTTIPDDPDLKFSHELWDFALVYRSSTCQSPIV